MSGDILYLICCRWVRKGQSLGLCQGCALAAVVSRLQLPIYLWNHNASLRWSFNIVSFSLAV